MKLVVFGGRHYKLKLRVFNALTSFHRENQIHILIHGNAGELDKKGNAVEGADRFAGEWADWYGVPCMVWPAAWRGLHKSAGPIRNQWMIDHGQPDMGMEFMGDKGTKDMHDRCVESKIPLIKIHETELGP